MQNNRNLEILSFLSELKENNNKEWFDTNREWYSDLRQYYVEMTETLIKKISEFDKGLLFEDAKSSMFRINRDIRFSKDKSPYKTNFGSYMVQGGKKSNRAGYYIHFEPDNCFLAGGIYCPPPDVLKRLRWAIFENIDEFLKIIENKDFKKSFGSIDGEKTKNPPKEFDKNFEHIDLLKFKDYNVLYYLKEDDLKKENFVENCLKVFEKMLPLNTFFNESLNDK